jgi:hypothetical protein
VSRIYVDLEVLSGGHPTGGSVDTDAVRSLEILEETGHEPVVVTGSGGTDPGALAPLGRHAVADAPLQPDEPAWYLTVDVDRCRGRSARLRTVLIGSPSASAIHRCDTVARDLRAAVLEIVAAEAMAPG